MAAALVAASVLLLAEPAGAQVDRDTPAGPVIFTEPSGLDTAGPDSDGFIALMVVAMLISAGIGIWKFATLRDMGIRRGMSPEDATTAALFSQDRVTSAMVLKPEVDDRRSRPRSRPATTSPPETEPTIEERLAKVEALRAQGLISDEEAASRRDELLDEI